MVTFVNDGAAVDVAGEEALREVLLPINFRNRSS